jgi:Holliday junction resolvase RusA-like endonuclease
MSVCLKIRIPYTPKAKASWRLGRYSTYNPSAKGMNLTRKYVEKALSKQGMTEPLAGPLLVIVHYRIHAPKFLPQRKRNPQHRLPHYKKPDGDNLDKFLGDALKGVVWKDDAQIVWMLRSKTFTAAKEGETILYVRQLEETQTNYVELLQDLKEHLTFEDTHEPA